MDWINSAFSFWIRVYEFVMRLGCIDGIIFALCRTDEKHQETTTNCEILYRLQ